MSFEVPQSEVNDFDALGTLSYQSYPKLLNSRSMKSMKSSNTS